MGRAVELGQEPIGRARWARILLVLAPHGTGACALWGAAVHARAPGPGGLGVVGPALGPAFFSILVTLQVAVVMTTLPLVAIRLRDPGRRSDGDGVALADQVGAAGGVEDAAVMRQLVAGVGYAALLTASLAAPSALALVLGAVGLVEVVLATTIVAAAGLTSVSLTVLCLTRTGHVGASLAMSYAVTLGSTFVSTALAAFLQRQTLGSGPPNRARSSATSIH